MPSAFPESLGPPSEGRAHVTAFPLCVPFPVPSVLTTDRALCKALGKGQRRPARRSPCPGRSTGARTTASFSRPTADTGECSHRAPGPYARSELGVYQLDLGLLGGWGVPILIWGVRLHECECMENLLNLTLHIYALSCRSDKLNFLKSEKSPHGGLLSEVPL